MFYETVCPFKYRLLYVESENELRKQHGAKTTERFLIEYVIRFKSYVRRNIIR